MEEIRTKIKQKRPVCDAKSGKRKWFPLSLPPDAFTLKNLNIYHWLKNSIFSQAFDPNINDNLNLKSILKPA